LDIGIIVTLIIAGISAVATVIIAFFTYKTIKAYEKQVDIGQEQVRVSQEQRFNQFRPILQPVGSLENIIDRSAGKPHIKWGYQNQVIDGLRNIGVGPAFNIYGILFGPPLITTPPKPPTERYVVWNYPALTPGEAGARITLEQSTNVSSETTIGGYPLYVPDDVDHIGIIARFTLTYHDVFGRKHASIYDYHSQSGWRNRGHFPNIDHDIYELDRQTPATQQAAQFFYNAGKRAQP
jgi:hypothetical protein